MYILGLSCYYHDSSAALMKDGIIVAAAEEERFTRKKHDSGFPLNASKYCLDSQGLSAKDLDYIAFYEKPLLKFERILHQHIEMFPFSLKTFLKSMPSWLEKKIRVEKPIRKFLGYDGDILYIGHHLSHAASAFLVSPFRKAAIVTVDGVGEWTTTAYGMGDMNNIRLLKEITFPHSIGLLYSTITAYLGFSVNNSEYKVMGLSAYGDMDRKSNSYYQKLRSIMDMKDDGSYRLDMSYFAFHHSDRMPTKKLCLLLGGPVLKKDSPLKRKHNDIAAALQMLTEDMIERILLHVHKETGCDNLVMAGGCALNSVYNGKILRRTPFKKIWIQPNASDGGTSVGAAAYVYNSILGKRRKYVMEDLFLGPSYTDDEIRVFLEDRSISYEEFKDDRELIEKTAKLIFKDNVVGWFQGRMEWGPRALGARSILANPCNPDAKELLNTKVKHRERFRPFAPAVCEDDCLRYFDCDRPVPDPAYHMLMVYPILKEWKDKIPSVTHVDGSGRLQVVRREGNTLYHDLIKRFGELSGIPVIINTSFNIRGEPIVSTPHDAYRCMMGTGIDYLVIGRFLIRREDNPDDMWDSESLARD